MGKQSLRLDYDSRAMFIETTLLSSLLHINPLLTQPSQIYPCFCLAIQWFSLLNQLLLPVTLAPTLLWLTIHGVNSYLMTSPFELSLPMGKHSSDFLLSDSNSIEFDKWFFWTRLWKLGNRYDHKLATLGYIFLQSNINRVRAVGGGGVGENRLYIVIIPSLNQIKISSSDLFHNFNFILLWLIRTLLLHVSETLP